MGVVGEVSKAASIGLEQFYGRMTEICRTVNWVLLLTVLQRKQLVSLKNIGSHGTMLRFQQMVKIFPVMEGASKIQLPQTTIWKDLHQIADLTVSQVKRFGIFVIKNIHR